MPEKGTTEHPQGRQGSLRRYAKVAIIIVAVQVGILAALAVADRWVIQKHWPNFAMEFEFLPMVKTLFGQALKFVGIFLAVILLGLLVTVLSAIFGRGRGKNGRGPKQNGGAKEMETAGEDYGQELERFLEDSRDDMETRDLPIPPAVTKALFREWRSPRFGKSNPERMNNPVWEWLVRSRASAYQINGEMGGPSPLLEGPGWCFNRGGRSAVRLSDGRGILIAGEHEDSYDPDFQLYNDVAVWHPGGRIDIFGYPPEVFPPICYQTATLVGNRIVIIGCLGPGEDPQRKAGTMPVYLLDPCSYVITRVETSGETPGRIWEHTAELTQDGRFILVQGGTVAGGTDGQLLFQNIDEWRLELATWNWERLTNRQWQQWQVRRQDGEMVHLPLMPIKGLCSHQADIGGLARTFAQGLRGVFGSPSPADEGGAKPAIDAVASLYRPSVEHQAIPGNENELDVYRVRVDHVVVRYEQKMFGVHVTIEGSLPQSTIETLMSDLRDKLARLEKSPCTATRVI